MRGKPGSLTKAIKVLAIPLAVLVGAVVFLGILHSPVQAEGLKKVTLRLSWLKEVGDHVPYYVAIDKGYYAKEGLDLKLFAGKGSPGTIKLLGGSAAGVFGLAGYESMATAVHQGVPVKGIFSIMQQNPMAVISHSDKPIKSVKDLVGKKYAVSPQSNQEIMFYAVLAAQNIPRERVKIVHAAFNLANTLLLERKVDAMLQWFPTAVPILESKGAKVHYLKYADMGVNVPANGLNANLKTIKEQPELIRKFLAATAKGFQLTRVNPEAAVAMMAKHLPRAAGKEKAITKNLKLALELWYTPNTKDKPIGWILDKDWDDALNVLVKVKRIDKKFPHDKYYTNEFNPGVKWKW